MKSIYNNTTPAAPAKPFPKLMQSTMHDQSIIVLMIHPTKGTVVHADDIKHDNVGYYSETWYMPDFKDLPSDVTITLQNE